MAVTETLGTSAELTAAGIAADNLVVALYFGLLFALARGLPPEAEEAAAGEVRGLVGRSMSGIWRVSAPFGRLISFGLQASGPSPAKGEPWRVPPPSNKALLSSHAASDSPALGYLQALTVSSGLCLLGTWISATLLKGAISSLPVISLLAVRTALPCAPCALSSLVPVRCARESMLLSTSLSP